MTPVPTARKRLASRHALTATAFAVLLGACGGGGDDGSSDPAFAADAPAPRAKVLAVGDAAGGANPAVLDTHIDITTEFDANVMPVVVPGNGFTGSIVGIYQTCKSCFWGLVSSDTFRNYALPGVSQALTSYATWGLRQYISDAVSTTVQGYGVDKDFAGVAGDSVALFYVGATHYSVQKFNDALVTMAGGRSVRIVADPNASPSVQYARQVSDMLLTDLIFATTFGTVHQARALLSYTSPTQKALTTAVAGGAAAIVGEYVKRLARARDPSNFKEVSFAANASRIQTLKTTLRDHVLLMSPDARREFMTRIVAAGIGANIVGSGSAAAVKALGGLVPDGARSVALLTGWFGTRRLVNYLVTRGARGAGQAPVSVPVALALDAVASNSAMVGAAVQSDSAMQDIEFLLTQVFIRGVATDMGQDSPILVSDADFQLLKARVLAAMTGTMLATGGSGASAFKTEISNAIATDVLNSSRSIGFAAADHAAIASLAGADSAFLHSLFTAIQTSSTFGEFEIASRSAAAALEAYIESPAAQLAKDLLEADAVSEEPLGVLESTHASTADVRHVADIQLGMGLTSFAQINAAVTTQGMSAMPTYPLARIREVALPMRAPPAKVRADAIAERNGKLVLQDASMNGLSASLPTLAVTKSAGTMRFEEYLRGKARVSSGQKPTTYQRMLLKQYASLDSFHGLMAPGSVPAPNAAAIAGGAAASLVISTGGAAALTYVAIGAPVVTESAAAFAGAAAAQAASTAAAPTAAEVEALISALVVENGEIVGSVSMGAAEGAAGAAVAGACLAEWRGSAAEPRSWLAMLNDHLPLGSARAQACAAAPAVPAAVVTGGVLGAVAFAGASGSPAPMVKKLSLGRYGYFERGGPQPFVITGANFNLSGQGPIASYNGQPCTIASRNATQVSGTCPAATNAGTYQFTATGVHSFPYSVSVPTRVPSVSTASPTRIAARTSQAFTLAGSWFTASSSVQLGGMACSTRGWTPTSLAVTCPGITTPVTSANLDLYEAATKVWALPVMVIQPPTPTLGWTTPPPLFIGNWAGAAVTTRASITAPVSCSADTLSYSSSDPAVASVDGMGRVTGLAAGSATVSVRSSGACVATQLSYVTTVLAAQPILVWAPAAPVATFNVGSTYTAKAAVGTPAACANDAIAYASSNPAVATVHAVTGVVSALAVGSATITATSSGNCPSAQGRYVAVVQAPATLNWAFTPDKGVHVGFSSASPATTTKAAVTAPAACAADRVRYTSSAPSIVSIDADTAVWTALSVGKATLSARSSGLCNTTTITRDVYVAPAALPTVTSASNTPIFHTPLFYSDYSTSVFLYGTNFTTHELIRYAVTAGPNACTRVEVISEDMLRAQCRMPVAPVGTAVRMTATWSAGPAFVNLNMMTTNPYSVKIVESP